MFCKYQRNIFFYARTHTHAHTYNCNKFTQQVNIRYPLSLELHSATDSEARHFRLGNALTFLTNIFPTLKLVEDYYGHILRRLKSRLKQKYIKYCYIIILKCLLLSRCKRFCDTMTQRDTMFRGILY